MTLDLPWPPSVNHYWRHNRGRTHVSTEGRVFRWEVSRRVAGRTKQTVDVRLDVRIIAHPPDKRRRDIDNIAKAVLDALVDAKVIVDDGHIDSLLLVRGNMDESRRGRVHVIIEPMP